METIITSYFLLLQLAQAPIKKPKKWLLYSVDVSKRNGEFPWYLFAFKYSSSLCFTYLLSILKTRSFILIFVEYF